jgi:hypothetical protein
MEFSGRKVMYWIPRSLAIVFFIMLLGFVVMDLGRYTHAKVLIASLFLLTTIVSWRSEPIGGGFFIILGSLYLIVTMGMQLDISYFLGVIPFFLLGSLFIVDYMYQEKKDLKEEVDF